MEEEETLNLTSPSAPPKPPKLFNFDNFNVDGISRFGIVWNNTKWYIGSSAILHAYNYHKSTFYTNSVFGSLNFYIGFNFGRKKD